jgi:hypothetical protein
MARFGPAAGAPCDQAEGLCVGADARKRVTLKLSKPLKRSLKRKRKLSFLLVMKVRDPAGNTRTLRKNVSLRLKSA